MYKIPANTLFIGKNLVYVPECHSTNTLARELGQKTGSLDGTVVVTDRQTAGKGQRGNIWEAEEGKNLTFSVILKPSFLTVEKQFNLNIIASLAVQSVLSKLLDIIVKIKWPNDIMVLDKKICGILIENNLSGDKMQQSIIGIGLNVNQSLFSVGTATSMHIEKKLEFDKNEVFEKLLEGMEYYYLKLRQCKIQELSEYYHKHLYWLGEDHFFKAHDKEVRGTIEGVDETGKLIVVQETGPTLYDLKEISFLNSVVN